MTHGSRWFKRRTASPQRPRQAAKRHVERSRSHAIESIQRARTVGFTLVELLVVIAIIAMFVSAMLPAVLAMRSSARRAQCQHHLLQLMMAAQNYEMANERYPAGVSDPASGPIRSRPEGFHQGWLVPLLPYMDEGQVYRRLNLEESVYAPANQDVRAHTIPQLICPEAASELNKANSSYAACHAGQETPIDEDNSGVFFLNSRITNDDVLDGLAQTIFLGEKRIDEDDLGWMSGTRATLRNTGTPLNSDRGSRLGTVDQNDFGDPSGESVSGADSEVATAEATLRVGSFGSSHPGGANMVFGDGRLQFVTHQIDPRVYQQLGDRDDGTLLNVEDYRE